jgi:hypothetical protein
MTDAILKKAIEKRDQAIREAERWDQWIKSYGELTGPAIEELDIPMARVVPPAAAAESADEIDLAPALRKPAAPTETKNGKGLWLRSGAAE